MLHHLIRISGSLRGNPGALFAFLARAWGSAAGLALVVLATTQLTAAEQGYFFTFQTLLQLQILFELGFAPVLTQFVSHEWAHLRLQGRHVEGDPAARGRLGAQVHLARRWYAGVAAAFLVLAAPAGYVFFALRPVEVDVAWEAPWFALCIAQAVAILYTPLPAMLEGTGDVARSQRSLLIANMVAGIGAWGALLAGAGLWAIVVQVGLRAMFALLLLLPATRPLRTLPQAEDDGGEWRGAFRRQQLRTTASWSAGLLMFQSFTPIAFAVRGAVVAGQVGVLVQAFHAVNQLGSVWLTAVQPRMGHLGALGRVGELQALVRQTLLRCLASASVLALAVLFGLAMSRWLCPDYAERFGSLAMAGAFLAAAIVLQAPNVWTAAIRFQKEEPFVLMMWASAALMAILYVSLGLRWAGEGIAGGFLGGIVALVVPWSHRIYRRRVENQPLVSQSKGQETS